MKKSSRRRYVRFHIGFPRRIFFSFYIQGVILVLIYNAKVERTGFYEEKDFVFLSIALQFCTEFFIYSII